MRELALFAGAGGGILGGLLIGWRTVCAVEIDSYARSVLLARQRDGILQPFPIWDDVRTFNGKPWRGRVDIVSGGFPCQDISCAGKGAGLDGERSGLWSEFARIIREVRPSYAFIENSPMLTIRGFDRILSDLASMGFNAEWGVVSASDVGAPHKRERIWIVANARRTAGRAARVATGDGRRRNVEQHGGGAMGNAIGERQHARWNDNGKNDRNITGATGKHPGEMADTKSERRGEARKLRRTESAQWASCGSESLYDADSIDRHEMRRAAQRQSGHAGEPDCGLGAHAADQHWPVEPALGRVAHGVAKRVDRLKAIGNGQVPRVAATAWRILSERFEQ